MGGEEGTSNGDGTECSEGLQSLKSDALDNGLRFGIGTSEVGGWSSGQSEGFRTYKRRKHFKSCAESKLHDEGGACGKPATQLRHQVCFFFMFVPLGLFIFNQTVLFTGFQCFCLFEFLDKPQLWSKSPLDSYSNLVPIVLLNE